MAKSINAEEDAFFFMEKLIREVSIPGEKILTLRSSLYYEESLPIDALEWIKEIGFSKWAKMCAEAWSFFVDMPAGIICYEIDERHKDCTVNCIDFGEAPKDEKPFIRIAMIDGNPKVFKLNKHQSKIVPQLLQVDIKLPMGILSSNKLYESTVKASF